MHIRNLSGCILVAAAVVGAALPAAAGTFDYRTMDRSLKEPTYGSAKPAYRFLAFGAEGKHVIAMVADASAGGGEGADVLYVDLNANRDLTEPSERFALTKPRPMGRPRKGRDDLVLVHLTDWGQDLLGERTLKVADPKLVYTLYVGHSFVLVKTTTRDGTWGFPTRIMDAACPWSLVKDKAPVIRFGGDGLAFGNEDFARRPGPRGQAVAVDPGKPIKTVRPGDNIYLDGAAPNWAGSSPAVGLGQALGLYVPWTDRNIQARIEVGSGPQQRVVHLPFYRSCGGAYWASVLVNTGYPHGEAALVLSIDTGGYLGKLSRRIPFRVDNPLYGRAIEELPVTKELRTKHPGAAVLEVYQGADLTALGVPEYDGARDVYFGDGRADSGFAGSCQNRGTGLSYGTELRYRLDLGGEGRRTLMKFDLSMLAPDTKVRQAVLALHVLGLKKGVDLSCRAFALKQRWSETVIGEWGGLNDAMGKAPSPPRRRAFPVGDVESWAEPMFAGEADRHRPAVRETTFRDVGWATVDVTPAVAKWVSGAWDNHGLALEMARPRWEYGQRDVWMASSDYAVDPRLRPRLVLVLDGKPAAATHRVEQRNADLAAAARRARAEKKLLLIHFLSGGSLTSRRFEGGVLKGVPGVAQYIDKRFVEARIDADDPRHKPLLERYGVRRQPTAVIAEPDPAGAFTVLEPLAWDALFGLARSSFEFEQLYTRELSRVLARHERTGSVRPTGAEIGGCGAP